MRARNSGDAWDVRMYVCMYEGWDFISGNYLFTTDTK